jgi:hypothetical protein
VSPHVQQVFEVLQRHLFSLIEGCNLHRLFFSRLNRSVLIQAVEVALDLATLERGLSN